MAHPRAITQADFEALKNQKGLYLIDFWATWCGPCKAMNPIIENLSEDAELSQITFLKVDVDAEPELSGSFRVTSIPTFYLLNLKGDGTFDKETDVLQKMIGAQSAFDFKTNLQSALSKLNS